MTCVDPAPEIDAREDDRKAVTIEVERRVAELSAELRACPSLKGGAELHVDVVVNEAGTTSVAITGATVSECSLVDCVRRLLNGLQVAPPVPGRDVSFSRLLSLELDAPVAFRDNGPRVFLLGQPPERRVACFDPDAEPRVPPEVIRQTVRAQYGRFRSCYEGGLARNRGLQGRITLRFVIERDGKVSTPTVAGNDLPDCQVAHCVRDAFLMLEFPPPKGGIVTVQYPIILQPG